MRRRRRRTAPARCGRARRRTRDARRAHGAARPIRTPTRSRPASAGAQLAAVVSAQAHWCFLWSLTRSPQHRDIVSSLRSLTVLPHVVDDLASGNGLLAGLALRAGVAKVAHGDRRRGELVGADDHREPRAGAIGGLHLRLHRARRRTTRSAETPAARSSCVSASACSPPVVSMTQTSTVDCRRVEHALGVAREEDALDARAEPDAGRGRTAELLGEPVVATAAADRVLGRVERVARELERGAGVVVEAADEQRVDHERRRRRLRSPLCTRSKCAAASSRQVVDRAGRGRDHRRVLAPLRVEHPQRVDLHRRPCSARRARRACAVEVGAQRVEVRRA